MTAGRLRSLASVGILLAFSGLRCGRDTFDLATEDGAAATPSDAGDGPDQAGSGGFSGGSGGGRGGASGSGGANRGGESFGGSCGAVFAACAAVGRCRDCDPRNGDNCPDNGKCECGFCVECTASHECGQDIVCDPVTLRCVRACMDGTRCGPGSKCRVDPNPPICVECTNHNDCANDRGNEYCGGGRCVSCVTDLHCSGNPTKPKCINGECGCEADSDCRSPGNPTGDCRSGTCI